MSSRVNIGKHVKDDHYRYTMEKLQLKIEGRGNGIKTILVNMANVARDLKVPPLYPTKYMGSELSTHASYDNKNDKYILNGKFDQGVIENSLNNFIQKFVLCKKCHYPEVVLSVDKTEQVVMTCMACGNVANVPPSEKLCKFIVTHPPPKQTDMKRVEKKTNAAASGAAEPVPEPVAVDDDVWETDISEDAIKQRLADEKLSSKIMEMTMSDDEKEEEEDGDEESPVSVLKEYLKLKPDANDAALIKAIKKIKKDYELSSKDVICLLFEVFFETADILNQIPKREPIFKHFLAEMKLSEVGQKVILGYVEELVSKKHKDLLSQVTKILTLLYKADLLDEPTALEWHKKKTSKYVKDAETLKKIKDQAKAFIEWLKTAADEEEEDENDE